MPDGSSINSQNYALSRNCILHSSPLAIAHSSQTPVFHSKMEEYRPTLNSLRGYPCPCKALPTYFSFYALKVNLRFCFDTCTNTSQPMSWKCLTLGFFPVHISYGVFLKSSLSLCSRHLQNRKVLSINSIRVF